MLNELAGQDRHVREFHRQLLDQLQRLLMIRIEGDDHSVRARLPGDVDEKLITRAFRFQPDGFDAQQKITQGLTRGIRRIHDRNTLYVLHMPPPKERWGVHEQYTSEGAAVNYSTEP